MSERWQWFQEAVKVVDKSVRVGEAAGVMLVGHVWHVDVPQVPNLNKAPTAALPIVATENKPACVTETPRASKTPVPPATETPVPPATETPVPPATETPVPPATETAVPPATETPVPPATATVWETNAPTDTPVKKETPKPPHVHKNVTPKTGGNDWELPLTVFLGGAGAARIIHEVRNRRKTQKR